MSRTLRASGTDDPVAGPRAPRSPQRILLDTDPGLDDLLALALALASPELELAAVTTVAGNAPIETVTENALRFRSLAGADFPIGCGASGPLALRTVHATEFHGSDGRRGVPMPEPEDTRTAPAAELLVECLRGCSIDRIVALGPLTNLAALLRKQPRLLEGVDLVWMGGTLSRGNVTELAEFNCYADPEAVAVVLDARVSLHVIGLEVTSRLVVRELDLGPEPFGRGRRARFLEGLLRALMEAERASLGEDAAVLHDPAAVIAASHPELFRFEDLELAVRVEEGPARGHLTRAGSANRCKVRYAAEVQADRIVEFFLARLRSWAGAGETPD
ncbi:MAG: nucleoside hydrolase [Myxococcales bacterium]|nr:nucleoside hydrolase [Myxococcales bacterium]